MNPDLATHLTAHFGVVTRAGCLELGVTSRQVDWMVAQGELVRVFRGVYRHAAAPVTQEQRLYAGLCAAGRSAVVSHRSGIALHGARNFACALVEVSVRSRSLPIREGLAVHRTSSLAPHEVCRRHGLPVTSPARSVVDAVTVMSPMVVAKIAQEWMAHKLLRVADLESSIHRVRRRPAVVELQRILADLDIGAVDSVPEGDLGRILAKAGLSPVLHHLVTTSFGSTFELDWSYPDARIGLEMDGYGIHLRSSDTFEGDRIRRNELTVSGWRILNFTSRMCRRTPWIVVQHVTEALSESSSPH